MVVVAQLVRVSVCGTECRGFESRLPPKKQSLLRNGKTFFVFRKYGKYKNFEIIVFVGYLKILSLRFFFL